MLFILIPVQICSLEELKNGEIIIAICYVSANLSTNMDVFASPHSIAAPRNSRVNVICHGNPADWSLNLRSRNFLCKPSGLSLGEEWLWGSHQ